MRTLLILAAVLPVVVQAQAPESIPTGQQNALVQSFADAVEYVAAGNAPTFVRDTKFAFGKPLGTGVYCVRGTGLLLPTNFQFYGVKPAVYSVTTDTGTSTPPWLGYAILTVCATGTLESTTSTWASQAVPGTWTEAPFPGPDGSYPVTVTTFWDAESQQTTTGWRAACAPLPPAPQDCLYTQRLIDGSTTTVACPKALTLTPGSFSGTVIYKPGVEWAGASSLPTVTDGRPGCAP